eukprot:scaffold119904_cov18-Tisochrysis_lutea.AAC.2
MSVIASALVVEVTSENAQQQYIGGDHGVSMLTNDSDGWEHGEDHKVSCSPHDLYEVSMCRVTLVSTQAQMASPRVLQQWETGDKVWVPGCPSARSPGFLGHMPRLEF